jgi:hypothetical protein
VVPELISIILGLRRLWFVAVCLMPATHPQTIKQPQMSSIVEGSLEVNNMDRWKSRGGKSRRRECEKEEDQRRERVRKKTMQVREQVKKSQNTVFFQCFVVP